MATDDDDKDYDDDDDDDKDDDDSISLYISLYISKYLSLYLSIFLSVSLCISLYFSLVGCAIIYDCKSPQHVASLAGCSAPLSAQTACYRTSRNVSHVCFG